MANLALKTLHVFTVACTFALKFVVAIVLNVLIIGILLVLLLRFGGFPGFQPHESSAPRSCQENLKRIDSSTEQYLMDNRTTTYPALSGLSPTYLKELPSCPKGGAYTIGSANSAPTCSLGRGPNAALDLDDHTFPELQ